MNDPVNRYEAAVAGIYPPDRGVTWSKTRAIIASGATPGSRDGMAKKVTGGIVAVAVVGLAGFFVAAGLNGQPSPLPAASASPTESPNVTEDPEPTDESHQDNDGLLQAVAERLTDPDLVWTRTTTGMYEHPDWGWVPDKTRVTTTVDGSKLRMTESWDGTVHTDRLVEEDDGQVTVLYLNMEDKLYSESVSDRGFFVLGYGAVPPSVVTPALLGALQELVLTGAAANLTGTPDSLDGRSLQQFSFEQSQLPALYQQASAQSASLWIDQETKLPVQLDLRFDTLWPANDGDEGLDRIRWELWANTEVVNCPPRDEWCGDWPCEPPASCSYFTTATFEWTTLAETTDFDLTVPDGFTQPPTQEDPGEIDVNLDELELPTPIGDCYTIEVEATNQSGEVVYVTLLCDALRELGF